jgi:hypothetical protein
MLIPRHRIGAGCTDAQLQGSYNGKVTRTSPRYPRATLAMLSMATTLLSTLASAAPAGAQDFYGPRCPDAYTFIWDSFCPSPYGLPYPYDPFYDPFNDFTLSNPFDQNNPRCFPYCPRLYTPSQEPPDVAPAGTPVFDATGRIALPLPVERIPQPLLNHHTYPAADLGRNSSREQLPIGTPVYAMEGGVVATFDQSPNSGGKCVQITNGTSHVWKYCHLFAQGVMTGNRVAAGALIGQSGNTGQTTGPHLHVQVAVNGEKRCPQPLIQAVLEGRAAPSIDSLPATGCEGDGSEPYGSPVATPAPTPPPRRGSPGHGLIP